MTTRNSKGKYSKPSAFKAIGFVCIIILLLAAIWQSVMNKKQEDRELKSPLAIPRAMSELKVQAKEMEQVEKDLTATQIYTEKQQILNYIVEVFGDDAPDAIVVIRRCENASFNPKAVNYNRNGTVDRGVFQLNSQYWGGEELFDWKKNVEVAYKVFVRAGKKWTPWSCAHVVGQKNYLGR